MTSTSDCKSDSLSPEIPSRGWRVTLSLMSRLPKGALSRAFGRMADAPLPQRLRRPVLSSFASLVGIDVSEAELPVSDYPSLNAFFVRRLRPGVRDWGGDPSQAGCPVDGVVGQVGEAEAGRLIQAKGRGYTVRDLLVDPREAERFSGGVFATIYLSPRHYHRIHAPAGGGITDARHIPGALFPVNAAAVAHLPELFARNERLACYIDTPVGRMAVVAVGAYNVGRISAAFDAGWTGTGARGRWVTNRRKALEPRQRKYDPPVPVRKGDEIMAFHLGSTVIVLFEPGSVVLDPSMQTGREIRLGSPMAHWKK